MIAIFTISVLIAVAGSSKIPNLAIDDPRGSLTALCAVKLLDASRNTTAVRSSAVYVSMSPEVAAEFQTQLLVAVHRSLRHTVMLLDRFDVKPFNPNQFTVPHAYLIAARDVPDLTDHLDTINVTAGSWRPEANFVVVLQEPLAADADDGESLKPVIRRMWKNFMLRSVILVPSSAASSGIVNSFAWYPFRRSCGRRRKPALLIGTCESEGLGSTVGVAAGAGAAVRWDASDAFANRVPDAFPGCEVTVAGFYWPPMTVLSDDNGSPRQMSHGMDVETVRLMGRAGNVVPVLREVRGDQRWGVKSPANGSWNGGFGELSAHRADLLIGGGILTAERLEMFDYAATRQVIRFPIYTPLPRRLPYWRNMWHVFSGGFWLTLSLAFVLTAGLVWLAGHHLPSERPTFADLGQCLVLTWSVLCSVSAGRQPTSAASKTVFLSWTVYALHISAVYTSLQLIYLYRPKYEPPMRTVDDVKRSGLPVCAVPTFIPIAHSMDPDNFNLTEFTPCTDMVASVDRLLRRKDIAILDPQDHFEALISGSVEKVNEIAETVIAYNIGIFMQKGNPYKKTLEKAQWAGYEMGLHDKWRRDASPRKQSKKDQQNNVKVKKLNLNELQGAFIILAVGLSVSLVVFVLECVFPPSAGAQTFPTYPRPIVPITHLHLIPLEK